MGILLAEDIDALVFAMRDAILESRQWDAKRVFAQMHKNTQLLSYDGKYGSSKRLPEGSSARNMIDNIMLDGADYLKDESGRDVYVEISRFPHSIYGSAGAKDAHGVHKCQFEAHVCDIGSLSEIIAGKMPDETLKRGQAMKAPREFEIRYTYCSLDQKKHKPYKAWESCRSAEEDMRNSASY